MINILVLSVLGYLVYAYVIRNNQQNVSACGLSCHSDSSGFSGLSALSPGPSQAGNCSCLCVSCPCSYIDNVLRGCSPAVSLYSIFIEIFRGCVYGVMNTMSDVYNYASTVRDCRISCQKSVQVGSAKPTSKGLANDKSIAEDEVLIDYEPEQKIKEDKKAITESALKIKKKDENLKASRSIVFKDLSNTSFNEEKENKENNAKIESCSKCKAKGLICIKSCPSARNKKI